MGAIGELAEQLRADEATLRRGVRSGLIRARRLSPRRLAVTPGERLYLGRHWPLLSRLLAALRTERAVRTAVVFGSVARGTDHAASDVDLLVSLREPALARRAALARRLERVAARPVQIVTLDEAERTPSLLAEILRQGRVLVDRDGVWARVASRGAEIERAAAREDARLERRARAAVERLRASP